MNKERPDERGAKSIVEKALGIQLEHADHNGGVDYLSTDGRHAVEVTRVTDGRKRAGRAALNASRETGLPEGELLTCWVAFVPDTQRALRSFVQAVHPAIVELERAGHRNYERQMAALHVIQQGPLAVIYRELLNAGVERASAVPNHGHRGHAHGVMPVLGSGGSSSGSEEAVVMLTQVLDAKKDNPTKLLASGREHRHLFVWLDDDTRFDIARPLSRLEAPSWNEDDFGVPTAQPELNPAVTHLWVVHQGSRRGWLSDGKTWRELRDV